MRRPSILLVDDDVKCRGELTRFLSDRSVDVHVADDAEHALGMLHDAQPDIVVAEIVLPGMSGVELARFLRDRMQHIGILFVTGKGDLGKIADLRDAGADGVLGKAVDFRELGRWIDDLLTDDERAPATHSRARAPHASVPQLIGRSRAMIALYWQILAAAESSTVTLIQGESGTGKELAARAIHAYSARWNEPYMAYNMAADRENVRESELYGHVKGAFTGADSEKRGLFAEAAHGSIVLDEIGDASNRAQRGLLRMLEEGCYRPVGSTKLVKVNARLIAITNRPLQQDVDDGRFRLDLYQRLKVIMIEVPPLRDRKSDIPLLTDHFLRMYAAECQLTRVPKLTADAWDALLEYDWPGNVRDLRNCIAGAVVRRRGRRIGAQDLGLKPATAPPLIGEAATSGQPRASYHEGATTSRTAEKTRYKTEGDDADHRRKVVAALKERDGNIRQAALQLGMSRTWLYRLIERFGITEADWKRTR